MGPHVKPKKNNYNEMYLVPREIYQHILSKIDRSLNNDITELNGTTEPEKIQYFSKNAQSNAIAPTSSVVPYFNNDVNNNNGSIMDSTTPSCLS